MTPRFKRRVKAKKSYWRAGAIPFRKSRLYYLVDNYIRGINKKYDMNFELLLHSLKEEG